ncbi:MAG: hypothetical protein K8R53_13660 [Bacteroidales bacterium]|nr:hypothetical protein [Bacteroidales bacterium]
MTRKYLCPHCKSHLRVRENIIFKVQTKEGYQGMMLLHPDLGNYSYISAPNLKFETDEKIEFFCPVCNMSLEAQHINQNLVHVLMIDESDNKEYHVFFSSVAEEHSTFKIFKDNIIEKFGEDSTAYVSYFAQILKAQMKANF